MISSSKGERTTGLSIYKFVRARRIIDLGGNNITRHKFLEYMFVVGHKGILIMRIGSRGGSHTSLGGYFKEEEPKIAL